MSLTKLGVGKRYKKKRNACVYLGYTCSALLQINKLEKKTIENRKENRTHRVNKILNATSKYLSLRSQQIPNSIFC